MSSRDKQAVVITGASSGLGLALSKKFLSQGASVFGVSKTKHNWKDALSAIGPSGKFSLSAVDLTKESAVQKFVKSVYKKSQRIDLLINSAGYGGALATVEQIDLAEFQKHLSQNLLSTFLMCKHVIPLMKKQKSGMIVNISSMAGKRAVPKLAAYSVAKFGILALSQCIAKENDTIKCLTVCPGGMNTKMRSSLFGIEDAQRQQSAEFVADVIEQVVSGKIEVDSGGDIVIRHGKITAINPVPAA